MLDNGERYAFVGFDTYLDTFALRLVSLVYHMQATNALGLRGRGMRDGM